MELYIVNNICKYLYYESRYLSIVTGLWAGRPGFHFGQGLVSFLFATV